MGNEWSSCLMTSNHKFHSWLIIGFVTRVTRRVTIVEQELLTLNSSSVFSEVCVAQFLVFCVMFCISLFVLLSFFFWPLFCLFFFDLRILFTPWYLQTFLTLLNRFTAWYVSKHLLDTGFRQSVCYSYYRFPLSLQMIVTIPWKTTMITK